MSFCQLISILYLNTFNFDNSNIFQISLGLIDLIISNYSFTYEISLKFENKLNYSLSTTNKWLNDKIIVTTLVGAISQGIDVYLFEMMQ